MLLATQQLIFKRLAKTKGFEWCNTYSSLVMGPVTFALPWIAYSSNSIGLWIYIIGFTYLFFLVNFSVLISQLVLSNNAVLISQRGRLNGQIFFFGSLFRASAPALMGVTFANTNQSAFPTGLHLLFHSARSLFSGHVVAVP